MSAETLLRRALLTFTFRRLSHAGVGIGTLLCVSAVQAATGIAPPAVYPADTWAGHTKAVLRVLDRLDSHTEILTIPVGETAHYHSLSLTVSACVQRPQTLQPDAAVHVRLEETAPVGTEASQDIAAQNTAVSESVPALPEQETAQDSKDAPTPKQAAPITAAGGPFDGWLLAGEPSVSVYASSLYSVQAVQCEGPETAPAPGPLPEPKAPQIKGGEARAAEPSETNRPEHIEVAHPAPLSSAAQPGHPLSLLPPSTAPLPPPQSSTSSHAPLQLAPPLAGGN